MGGSTRFDDFTRMLGAGLTRRRALQLGAASVAATALQTVIGTRPAFAACPPGAVTCGDFCCVPAASPLGSVCCNPPFCATQRCICPFGPSLCTGPNPNAPPATIGICCNVPTLGGTDVCLPNTPNGPVCCPAAQVCGAPAVCCATGETCVAGACCATAQVCGGVCCPAGATCIGGACCPAAQTCGAACCSPVETCIGGTTCCPAAQVCGTSCCAPGQTCNTYPLGTFTCV